MTDSDSLITLNAWFASHGSDAAQSTMDAWTIWVHQDAWVFTPSDGQKPNRLYMVRDLTVVTCAVPEESIEAAYARLDTSPDPPGPFEPKPLKVDGAILSGLPDGTHYYLEEGWREEFPFGPMVYRVTVVNGQATDAHWDTATKRWVASLLLVRYAIGPGADLLYAATPQEAERWRQRRQERWNEAHAER